jgi:predicted transcriptional regulator
VKGIPHFARRKHLDGMKISDIQTRLGVPASTLAFHLGGLVGVGLVSQEKVGREVICRARHRQLTAVMKFLREHCCEGFVLHVVQSAGMAEHFGTRHLGNLNGVSSMVGIFGTAAGPLPFAVWPSNVGYLIFLASMAGSLAVGAIAIPRPFLRAEVVKP